MEPIINYDDNTNNRKYFSKFDYSKLDDIVKFWPHQRQKNDFMTQYTNLNLINSIDSTV